MTSHINNTSNALNRKSAAVYIIPTLHLRVLPVHAITRLYAAVRYLHLRDIYVPTYLYIYRTNPNPKSCHFPILFA